MLTPEEKVKLAVAALEEKKGNRITVLDVRNITVTCDYFVIVSGDNDRQVTALCDEADEKLGRAGAEKKNVEGYHTGDWILLDYGDVIIHVFSKEAREYYDLERIWRDAKKVEAADL